MMRQDDPYRQKFSQCGTTMIQQGAIVDGCVWRMVNVCVGLAGPSTPSPPSSLHPITWMKTAQEWKSSASGRFCRSFVNEQFCKLTITGRQWRLGLPCFLRSSIFEPLAVGTRTVRYETWRVSVPGNLKCYCTIWYKVVLGNTKIIQLTLFYLVSFPRFVIC